MIPVIQTKQRNMESHSSKIDIEIKKAPLPSGNVNVGFEPGESQSGSGSKAAKWPSTESDPPAYNEAIREEGDGIDIELVSPESEDERIMSVLREIVRKCTNVNPMKRPTAKEVLEMLEEVAPSEYFDDDFEFPDDDDDRDDYDDFRLSRKKLNKSLKED